MGRRFFLFAAASFYAAPLAASPATATLNGSVINSCILTISASGTLVSDSAGTTMRSDTGTGASSAVMAVVAQGASPTLTFSAPVLSGPAGFVPDTVQFAYAVAGSGESRSFSVAGGTAAANLIDTVTIDGLVTSATGFPAGNYSEGIQVTCGQS